MKLFLVVILLFIGSINCAPLAYGEREIEIYSPISGLETEIRSLFIPMTVTNLVGEMREISLNVTCPSGWRYSILFNEYNVSKITLRGNEAIDLTFVLEPISEISAGQYNFSISAYRQSQIISNTLTISVKIVKPVAVVSIESTATEVSGSPGSVFSFRFNIKNYGYRDLTLKLNAEVPSGWSNLGFKPSPYETKVISDVTVKARSTYWSITLDVHCPQGVTPGAYPIKVIVSEPAAGIHEEFTFRAIVSGIPKITLKTKDGLLSYSVEAGGELEIPVIIENAGTVPLREINVYCIAPLGWEIEVDPSRISSLPVKESANVVLRIKSPSGAIAGDYSLAVHALSVDAFHEIMLRITVTKTTYWGVIGIVVIVVSVLCLVIIFWRYGRL